MSKNTVPMTIREAEGAWLNSKPWRILLTFQGSNYNNISGKSDKWWTAYGDGSGRAFINFGKSGSLGRAEPVESSVYEAIQKAHTKVHEGYQTYIAPKPTAAPPPVKKTIPLEILNLPAPFCDIRMVRATGGGTNFQFWALDESEKVLAEIPASSFDSLVQMGRMVRVTNTPHNVTEWRI